MIDVDPGRLTVFRPGWRWRTLMMLLSIAFVGFALVAALLAVDLEEPWLWVLSAVTGALGIIMLIRVPLVRLAYDDQMFLAAGVLWSRRIALEQVDEVDVAPEAAVIHWTSTTGRARTTPLTAVNAGRLGWLPQQARRRRVDYLKAFDSFLVIR